MRTQETESSQGIGHVPGGLGAALGRERLRKNEIAVHRIGQAECGCGPERKTQVDVAEIAADGRANDEAESERGADEAKRLGPFFGRCNVGDVGKGGSDVGSGDAGNEATEEKPPKRRSQGHKNVINGEAEAGNENDRPAAETV